MDLSFKKSDLKSGLVDVTTSDNGVTRVIPNISQIKHCGRLYTFFGAGSQIKGSDGKTCYVSRKSFRKQFFLGDGVNIKSKVKIPKHINCKTLKKVYDSALATNAAVKKTAKRVTVKQPIPPKQPIPTVKETPPKDPKVLFEELRGSDRWNGAFSDGAPMFDDDALRFVIKTCDETILNTIDTDELALIYKYCHEKIKGKSVDELHAIYLTLISGIPELEAEITPDALQQRRIKVEKEIKEIVSDWTPENIKEMVDLDIENFFNNINFQIGAQLVKNSV